MSEQQSNSVGYVTAVRGSRMQARIAQPNSSESPFDTEQLVPGQLGSYLVIKQGPFNILAIVQEAVLDEPEALTLSTRMTLARQNAHQIVSLIPLGQFAENIGFQRGVKHFPVPGAAVHAVSIEDLKKIFAAHGAYGFHVGRFSAHPSLDFSLNPSVLFGRHFAILGQSGSGKSWAVTSLVQRAIKSMPKAHIILLDLHGEYCWRDENRQTRSAFANEAVRYIPARQLEIPYWLMTYAELIDLLIDRGDPGASVQMAFLRDVLLSLKTASAKELGMETVSVDSPIFFSLDDVYQHFEEANEERLDFGKAKGIFYGQFDKFLVKLQSRLNDVRYDFLLKPKRRNHSDSLLGLIRDFVGLGDPKCQVTVLDLSTVPFDVRPSVSAQIGRLAFEFNYWNPRNREFPILLLCEEAHAYIPRESNTQYEGTRKSMERIAKEGRKYGVGLGVVSQRPHELSETVLSQCATFICFRITNPDDQTYVRDLVPEAEGELTDILTTLARGEAMVLGEAAALPTRFQVYQPDPPPNSNDLDFFSCWRSGPDDLDIDGIVNRWRRQGQL